MHVDYGLVDDPDTLDKLCKSLIKSDAPFGFDIETGYYGEPKPKYSLHVETAFIVGFSLSGDPSWARYVPLGHDNQDNVDLKRVAHALAPLLASGKAIAHNFSFELKHTAKLFSDILSDDEMARYGLQPDGYWTAYSDSMIEAYLLAKYKFVGLKPLVKEVFNHDQAELVSLFPAMTAAQQKCLRFNPLPLTPQVISYACEDAAFSLALSQLQRPQLENNFLYPIEMQIIPITTKMERKGVRFDWLAMRKALAQAETFQEQLGNLIQQELAQLCGVGFTPINLGSPQQVASVLFDKLGWMTTKLTDAGKMSTSSPALQTLAKRHSVVQQLLYWRELKTLIKTYLTPYESAFSYAKDGRTHPNLNQTRVISGRFAHSEPNYAQCMDSTIEVLTPTGWKRISDLVQMHGNGATVQVAQFSPNQECSYDMQHTDETIEFVSGELVAAPYKGDMVCIGPSDELHGVPNGKKGTGGTWLYTPNHRLPFRKRSSNGSPRYLRPIQETTASEWASKLGSVKKTAYGAFLGRRIPVAGFRSGGKHLSTQERLHLQMAIACQADGNLRWDALGGEPWFDVAVTLERKCVRLFELSKALGLSWICGSDRERVRVPGAITRPWLDRNKNFRYEPVLGLCSDDLRWFVLEIMHWDGAFEGKSYGQNICRRRSVEVVQTAAVLCGMSASICEHPKYTAVYTNVADVMYRSFFQKSELVPFDGTVYCVTVPSGMVLVRNEQGIVQVTGNSPKRYHYEIPGAVFDMNFRDFTIAEPDHYLIGFDMSQAELRVLAGESREPALLQAFEDGIDVHKRTAALLYNIDESEVTKEQRSVGKAQPIDAEVLTPYGWQCIGDIEEGDLVIGSNGLATRVTGIFPQGEQEIFRVATTEGLSTEATSEHLFTVLNCNTHDAKWRTRPLSWLMRKGVKNTTGQNKLRLPSRPVVQYALSNELPLDPYVLGLLLGDGCFRHDWAVSYSSEDFSLIEAVQKECERLGGSVKYGKCPDDFWVIYLTSGIKGQPNRVSSIIRDLGLRMKLDHEKFIPEVYLRASPEDRLAVLQGLMDTDGNCHQTVGSCFASVSSCLAKGVGELVKSLGGLASAPVYEPYISKSLVNGRIVQSKKMVWRPYLNMPTSMVPFRLERKVSNFLPSKKEAKCLTIQSIEPTNQNKSCVCISVEANDGLYITDNYILTHNTLNFATLYGQGPKSMADGLGMSITEAKAIHEKYFATYSQVKTWMDKQTKIGQDRGFITTKFGRRCPIWEYESDKPGIRAKGDRLCVNAIVQGSATGDAMKISMIKATKAIEQSEHADKIHLIMNVHDALIFEVHKLVPPQYVIDIVHPQVVLSIPGWPVLECDWEVGLKWGSMKSLALDANGQIELEG